MLALRPSAEAAVALSLLAAAGASVEAVVWRGFRRRWAGETDAHPMDVPQPLRRPIELIVVFGALVAALAWKAVGLGSSWPAGVAIGAGYVLFVLLLGFVLERAKR